MRLRFVALAGLPGMIAVLLFTAAPTAAQNPKAPAKRYSPRRMSDGHPDLQGTYDLATLTPVERPAGVNAVLTDEEARRRETAASLQREQGDKAIQGDRTAPPKGGDGSRGAAGNVGGYNSGWLDPGSTYTVVNGEVRSSFIVDPPDGRVPPLAPGARQRMAAPARDPRRTRLRTVTIPDSIQRPAPMTIRNAVRSGSAACWVLVPLQVRRCCRTTFTTISIRSCRRRTR